MAVEERTRDATKLFRLVLEFRRFRCLPLHVARTVGAAALERRDMIDDVAGAGAGYFAGRGAGMRFLKGMFCAGASLDSSMRVAANARNRLGACAAAA